MSRPKFLPFGLWLPDRSIFEPGVLRRAENLIRLHGQWRLVESDSLVSESDGFVFEGTVSQIHKVHCHIFDISSKQRMKPVSEVTNSNFNNDYESIDEDYFSNEDYIFTDGDPTNAIYRTKLSFAQEPPASSHEVYFHYRVWNLDAGEAWTLVVRLKKNDGTLVASTTISDTGPLGWTPGSFSLSAGEIATLVAADYSTNGLDIEFDATTDTNGEQVVDPAGDVNPGGWEEENGETTDLHLSIADSDDATYAISKLLSANQADEYEFSLDAPTLPPNDGIFRIDLRLIATNSNITGRWQVFSGDRAVSRLHAFGEVASPADGSDPVAITRNATFDDTEWPDGWRSVNFDDLRVRLRARYSESGASTDWATDYAGSDVEANTWTPQTGPDLYEDLDDENDATYISHGADDVNPNFTVDTADNFDVDAENPLEQDNSAGQIRIRARSSGSGTRSLRVQVYEEGNVVASTTLSLTADGSWYNLDWDISTEDGITDFEAMRVKVRHTKTADETNVVDISTLKLMLAAARRLKVYKASMDFSPKNHIAVSWAQMTIPEEASDPQTGDFDRPIFAVGGTVRLYEYCLPPDPGWTDRSKGGLEYSPGPRGWDFCSYGQSIIATNYVDPVQVMDVQSDSAYSDLIDSASKPKARFVDVFGNQVALGDINYAGAYSDEVWLMAIDDATDADDASSIRQRTYPIPGQIAGLAGGKWGGLVLKRAGILLWSYIGGSAYWRQDILTESVGTGFSNSIIKAGDAVYFFGYGQGAGLGFYRILGGVQVERIDAGVRRFFTDWPYENDAIQGMSLDDPRIVENSITGAACPITGLIFWLYRRPGGTAYQNDRVAVFNPEDESFSVLNLNPTGTPREGYSALAPLLNPESDLPHAIRGLFLFRRDAGFEAHQFASPRDVLSATPPDAGWLPAVAEGSWEQLDGRGDKAYRIVAARPVMRSAVRASRSAPPTWQFDSMELELEVCDDPLFEENLVTEAVTGEKANSQGWLPFNLRGRFVKAQVSIAADFPGSVRELIGVQLLIDEWEGP